MYCTEEWKISKMNIHSATLFHYLYTKCKIILVYKTGKHGK